MLFIVWARDIFLGKPQLLLPSVLARGKTTAGLLGLEKAVLALEINAEY